MHSQFKFKPGKGAVQDHEGGDRQPRRVTDTARPQLRTATGRTQEESADTQSLCKITTPLLGGGLRPPAPRQRLMANATGGCSSSSHMRLMANATGGCRARAAPRRLQQTRPTAPPLSHTVCLPLCPPRRTHRPHPHTQRRGTAQDAQNLQHRRKLLQSLDPRSTTPA